LTAPRPEPASARLRLVFISPGDRAPDASLALIEQALAGGVTAVLLREPGLAQDTRSWLAQSVVEAAHEAGALALVHNDVALALECAADGVHAGHGGPTLAAIRAQAPALLAGRSAHWPMQPDDLAADYVFLSPFRPTPKSLPRPLLTAAQVTEALVQRGGTGVVALGGLQESDVASLPKGLAGLAVLRAIADAPDPRAAAAALRRAVDSAWPAPSHPAKKG
jgi:thiamine-phosphate pyrophosphorylase